MADNTIDAHNDHPATSTSDVREHLQTGQELRISPTDLGSIVKQGQSPLYIKLQGDSKTRKAIFEDDKWVKKSSLAILATEGNEFEQSVYDELERLEELTVCECTDIKGDEDTERLSVEESRELLRESIQDAKLEEPSFGTVRIFKQFPLQGNIGPFSVAGDSDMICVFPKQGEGVEIRVFDIKASWSEKTSQQIQTSLYTLLIKENFEYLDNLNVDISAGIIHKENKSVFEDTDDFPSLDELPSFNVEPREDDARRLLDKNSDMYEYITKYPTDEEGNYITDPSVDELLNILQEIPFQISSQEENSPYRDFRFTNAIENLDVAVLGITRGTRRAMHENEIYDLRDLANLTENNEQSSEYMDITVKPEHEERVQELQRDHGVQDIKNLSMQAKLYIGKLIPDDPDVDGMNQILPSKENVYPKTLPMYKSGDDRSIDPDKGLKVFINPQYDYVSDTIIQLNAKIKSAEQNSDKYTRTITKTVEDIPIKDSLIDNDIDTGRVDVDKAREYERELVREFTQELLSSIEQISVSLGIEKNTFIHFYLYSQQEEKLLVESMERHSHIESVDAFRNLLGVRDMGEREQQLWGYIEDDLKRCYLINQLPTFLPAMHDSFAGKNRGADGTEIWGYEYSGEDYNLNGIFSEQFFDYKREYTYKDGVVTLDKPSESGSTDFDDDTTPVEAYTGSQLPLEYFWGCREFDVLDETINMEDADQKFNSYVQQFLYKYRSNNRISLQDLSAFGSWVVDALDFIESQMKASKKVNKKPMDVSNISEFTIDSNSFDDSIQDYLEMEHESQREEQISDFQKPISARIKSGKAIPMFITNIERTDGGHLNNIEGKLIYKEFGFDNLGFVKSSSKKGEGDYMVMSPFKKTSDGIYTATNGDNYELSPEDILKSPAVSILDFDTVNNSIKLSIHNYRNNDRRTLKQTEATEEPYNQPIFEGQKIILDDQLSTFILRHNQESLEHADRNKTYNVLDDTLNGDNNITETTKFDSEKIDEFLEAVDEADHKDIIHPNEKQQELVKNLSQICLLQGPPGTGKTSGALTSTIISRIHANTDWSMNGLVTGPSNTSVDELVEDVVGTLDLVTYHTALSLDVKVYHLVSKSHEPTYSKEVAKKDNLIRIEDLEGAEARMLIERLENQQITGSNTIVFGMPNTIKRLLEKQGHKYQNAKPWFDLFIADEASMLTLPKLITAGAYFDPNGQMIVSGDHRQMSPVQTHEWKEETRPSIQKYIPYLSVLDYMRFLRGDELERIGFPDAHIQSPSADIPLEQLEVTYRCHETIADFLQEWVYSADNINYKSNVTDTLSLNNTPKTDALQAVLGDDPMVVITHNDTQSQESNVVESHIAEGIMKNIDTHNKPYDEDDDEYIESGVVTPHSSQKGLLRDKGVSDEADTVERFQGGEKDMIMVSATVSDPAFIQKEDEFLLNPNRVNVAISRMKNKLIVIVPDSVFEHIPADVDVYDKSVIWNGLYNTVVDERGSEKWTGYLNDFVGKQVSRGDVEVSVYTK